MAAVEKLRKEVTLEDLDQSKFLVYGLSAFLGIRAVVYPATLENLKAGTLVRRILKTDGIFGLYRGFPVAAVGTASQVVYLYCYEWSKTESLRAASSLSMFDEDQRIVFSSFVAGGTASLGSLAITVPIDVISQRLMIHNKGVNNNSVTGFSVIRSTLQYEGIRGLYRGFFCSLLTYAPSSSIWWFVYSGLRRLSDRNIPQDGPIFQSISQSACGATAGIVSVVLTNPLDVIKTRLQTLSTNTSLRQYRFSKEFADIVAAFRQLIATDGLKGMTKGMLPRCLQHAPVSVLMTLGYESVKKWSLKEPR